MTKFILKWAWRVVVTAVAAFIVLYLGDMAVYSMRGSPQGRVHVNQTIVVPLKGNKQEYDHIGASDVPCSESIFSQNGEDACWLLRRNQNKATKM